MKLEEFLVKNIVLISILFIIIIITLMVFNSVFINTKNFLVVKYYNENNSEFENYIKEFEVLKQSDKELEGDLK